MCKTRNFISPPISAPYKANLVGFLLCKVVVLLNPRLLYWCYLKYLSSFQRWFTYFKMYVNKIYTSCQNAQLPNFLKSCLLWISFYFESVLKFKAWMFVVFLFLFSGHDVEPWEKGSRKQLAKQGCAEGVSRSNVHFSVFLCLITKFMFEN